MGVRPAGFWRTRSSRRKETEGFSLLEVLVATTLMGLVLVVLLQVLTAAFRAQEASRGRTQALLVAEKVLQEHCARENLAPTTYHGREGRYDYQVQITPQYEIVRHTAFAGRKIACALIQVKVSWPERGRVKSLSLQTMRTAAQKIS